MTMGGPPPPQANIPPANVGFTEVGAVGQSRTLTGAKILAATLTAPPQLAYYYAKLDDAGRTRALKEIAKRGGQMFAIMRKSVMEGIGLIKQPPASRLNFYRNVKTPEMWAEHRAKYPQSFQESLQDYIRLEALAAAGMYQEVPPKQLMPPQQMVA